MTKHTEIAILGAGPVGLEAALAAAEAGRAFTVFEAGSAVATNVRSWGHVQLFTPWSMSVSARARSALDASAGVGGATAATDPVPDGGDCPTGDMLADKVFDRLAALPGIASHIRLNTRVIEIGRDGLLKNDEIGTRARGERPFRLLVRTADGEESLEYADVVLDCTGTWDNPNALGSGGVRAPGEDAASKYIVRRIPDFEMSSPGDVPDDWEGRRILLVGAGHSAQTAARDLAALVERVPTTTVTWLIRSTAPTFGAVESDPLPARDELVRVALRLALGADSPFDVRLGRSVEAIEASPDGIVVSLGPEEEVIVDRILSLTGSVGDARMYRQLQVHECWATSGPMKLAAALLSSSSADCLTQESHGADTLKNPEPNFYILGSKSYGRNTAFLMRVGWDQVDEVFSLLPEVSVHA
jgi:hypothetical protein